mmetsp:Transcript_14691/g.22835  ORF Transcript_14691/g.22835 Transcript_14691/m.22835 type:complete len:118 (+) Transcript_14691:358-711(+)
MPWLIGFIPPRSLSCTDSGLFGIPGLPWLPGSSPRLSIFGTPAPLVLCNYELRSLSFSAGFQLSFLPSHRLMLPESQGPRVWGDCETDILKVWGSDLGLKDWRAEGNKVSALSWLQS